MWWLSPVIAGVAAAAAIAAAYSAWRTFRLQREQLQHSGFVQIQGFMERRRDERRHVLSIVLSHSYKEKRIITGKDPEHFRQHQHNIACDFNDMGALIHHKRAPVDLCLELWGGTILTHWHSWLDEYVKFQRNAYKRPRYWHFIVELVEKARKLEHSVRGPSQKELP